MKNLLLSLFSVLALMSVPNNSSAQSNCNIDFVYDILNASINIQAINFPAGVELTWSIDGVVFEVGVTDIMMPLSMVLQGPVELCVIFSSTNCPDGITFCEVVDITSLVDCLDPTLIDPLAICTDIWTPVCGCNGITYSNECYAINYGGVTSWTPGECSGGCPTGLFVSEIDFNPCSWIFEIQNALPGAVVEWSFGDGAFLTSSSVEDHSYANNGIYEVSAYYTDDVCQGVVLTETIEVFGCGNDAPCSIEMEYELFYDPVEEIGYGIFEAFNYPDSVELIWTMNDAVIATGVNMVEITEPVPFPVGGVTICVSYESTDCPLGASACQWLGADGEGPCGLEMTAVYEGMVGVYEAYNYPDGVNLVWTIDGVAIDEGTNVVELSNEEISNGSELCVYYESVECGEVVVCEVLEDTSSGDCPTEIAVILPKWDMCSWAFEVVTNDVMSDAIWMFGDGSQAQGGSWMSHVYSEDGIYTVTVLYFSESCPNGTEIHLTISVEGCYDNEGDCIHEDQIDPTFACTEEYVPVCGCDSITYSNECYAYHYGGVTSWVAGECTTAVEDIVTTDSWTVFPVPTSGDLIISGLGNGVWSCKMYDSQGRNVMTKQVVNGEKFSLDNLSEGWYTLQIVGVLGSAKRVLVQR